ncbi:alpha/beta hydrolase [Amycolatopsis thermoflava]|uniref:alpha/beta hydrolase n=1 Tax=Amycolatopsis thermoflava TaxID=84480 RepID=UPI00040A960B|nr:alpha/beta fold hydrolase [Amycolatopsis thermoflava]
MPTFTRLCRAAAACALALATLAAPAHASPAPTSPCREVTLPVSLTDGSPAQLAGTLCVPEGADRVAVLIPGITYDRHYWDFPYQTDIYSFTRHANEAGLATLALDKLGTGRSTHPPSTQVTLPNQIATVHQTVQALRTGALGPIFTKVALVGHSYGSIIAYALAGTHPRDVDALVTTGVTHTPNLVTIVAQVFLHPQPAMLDPKFAPLGLDAGYITTQRGRKAIFYDPRTSDPAVIARDNELRDLYTLGDLATYLKELALTSSRGYNGPVYVVNGGADQLMCGAVPPMGAPCSSGNELADHEKPLYGPEATVDGAIIPDTGHDLTLSTTAPDTAQNILDWLNRH